MRLLRYARNDKKKESLRGVIAPKQSQIKNVNQNSILDFEFRLLNSVKIYGLEDKDIYSQNLYYLSENLKHREEINKILKSGKKIVTKGKKLLYSQEMKKLDEIKELYNNRRVNLREYLKQNLESRNQENNQIPRNNNQTIINHTNSKQKNKSKPDNQFPNINLYLKKTKKVNTNLLNQEISYLLKNLNGYLNTQEINSLQGLNTQERYLKIDALLRKKRITCQNIFPNLYKHIQNIKLEKKVNIQRVLEEVRELEYEVLMSLCEGKQDVRDIVYMNRYLSLLKKYINNKLDTSGVKLWEQGREKFYRLMKTLGNKLGVNNKLSKNESFVRQAEENMKNFYKTANERDEILVANMLKLIQNNQILNTKLLKRNSEPVFGSRSRSTEPNILSNEVCVGKGDSLGPKFQLPRRRLSSKLRPQLKCGVMIVGGFHTNGITKILRAKGISYEVIQPKTNSDTIVKSNKIYEKRMRDLGSRVHSLLNSKYEIQNPNYQNSKHEIINPNSILDSEFF